MKKGIFFGVLFVVLLLSCSKRETVAVDNMNTEKLHYDTTAIDSFSDGAVSVDIARQIRMSSQKYKDSLREVAKIQQEEKRIEAELAKENKKKEDDEKKAKTNETPSVK